MKYLAVILGIVFLTSCGGERNKGHHHPDPKMCENETGMTIQERDSIHEERKRKRFDRLTEKLDLTDDQMNKIKQLEADYYPQLKELRKEMSEVREKHHQLLEEKRGKMKEILTPEQVEKLETMRKESRKKHRKSKKKNSK